MANGISIEDVADLDFLDAEELISDGSSNPYRTGVSITSVTSSTKRIVSPSDILGQFRDRKQNAAEVGDKVVISGNAAAGTYTIATIVDDVTLEVVEAIVDASGGTLDLVHPAGATKVGVDPSGLDNSSSSTVQGVLDDLDAAITSGGITEFQHENLDTLVHRLAETSYLEVTRSSGKVTDVIVWTDNGKTTKIREMNVTRTSGKVSQVVLKQYDGAGSLTQTLTKTITRTSGRVSSIDVVET